MINEDQTVSVELEMSHSSNWYFTVFQSLYHTTYRGWLLSGSQSYKVGTIVSVSPVKELKHGEVT